MACPVPDVPSGSGSGSGSGGLSTACEVVVPYGDIETVAIGAPYREVEEGLYAPDGLRMLMALIDGGPWPVNVCGDQGIGYKATHTGDFFGDGTTVIDEGPFPGPPWPLDPTGAYTYPGVGVTAFGCVLNCNYVIVGTLGADVIVGLIDGQYHILRVLHSASTTPLFGGPSNDCRCCGQLTAVVKRTATIIDYECEGNEFGGCTSLFYPLCTEFLLDPIEEVCNPGDQNPLGIRVRCVPDGSTKILERKEDWEVEVCNQVCEVISVTCAAPICDCVVSGSGSGATADCIPTGSGSGSGSGSGGTTDSWIEIIARTPPLPVECGGRWSYTIRINIRNRITTPGVDACVEFDDVEYGEPVIMEACGIAGMEPGDRVIGAYLPGGRPGRDALGGADPVEYFAIRSCSARDCPFPCDGDTPTPYGPPCCGKYCSEHPDTLTMTIEVTSDGCPCADALVYTLGKDLNFPLVPSCGTEGGTVSWTRYPANGVFDGFPKDVCAGAASDPPPGGYPTWIEFGDFQLICGTTFDEDDNPLPTFVLRIPQAGSYLGSDTYEVTCTPFPVSTCSPLYLEFDLTAPFCNALPAGVIDRDITMHITIS